jgi:predicted nuclease of predicted toxin-antitoxin system
MKLKVDENLGHSVAELFRQAGHDTTTVPSEGLCSASDRALAEACRQDARALVTLDLDFGNPLLFKPSEHHGFAILRVPGKGSLKYLSDLARMLIRRLAEGEIRGKLWIVEAGRIREHIED